LYAMVKFIMGYKKGMTQVYKDGAAVPVTVVEIPENTVVRVSEKEGTVDLGLGKKKHPTSADKGKFSKIFAVPRSIWTVSLEDGEKLSVGDVFGSGVCTEEDLVSVTGITKAKGFIGVVKRWGFHGGPRTHGQSDRQRAPGSIGAGTDPGRVLAGKKMAGRLGGVVRMLRNRKIVGVGEDFLLIKGAIPGNPGGLIKIERMTQHES